MNPSNTQLLSVAVQAVQAGAAVVATWQGRFEVREKAPADLVTDADVASERAIHDVIRRAFPDHAFLGEEGAFLGEERAFLGEEGASQGGQDAPSKDPGHGPDSPHSATYRWVADPIDGTTNFAHGIPFYCISLAVQNHDESVVGAILDPNHDELFTAMRGDGTKCNGERVTPPACRHLRDAVLAVSLPPRLSESRWELESLKRLVPHCRAFRRTGSAALNLCYVASGRIHGFWASSLNLWDRAAGELFVREVGGVVTDIDGHPLTSSSRTLLAAGDSTLHAQLLSELKDIPK